MDDHARPAAAAAGPVGSAHPPGGPHEPAVTVALVDDHHLVREGVRAVLEAQPGILVVGEAADAVGAFGIVEREDPDVLVLDVTFPDADGIAVLRELVARWPRLRVVILTMHRDAETVRQALRAGASGYVVKGAHTAELVEAVRAVHRGERYLHSSVAGVIIDDSLHWMEVGNPLSAREREILAHIAAGASAADVGRELGISPHTVRRHVANLSAKLGLTGPKALTRYAVEQGLLREDRRGPVDL
jgi:two-component system, NarL family, nitrate/nitrite response regulator NarL